MKYATGREAGLTVISCLLSDVLSCVDGFLKGSLLHEDFCSFSKPEVML